MRFCNRGLQFKIENLSQVPVLAMHGRRRRCQLRFNELGEKITVVLLREQCDRRFFLVCDIGGHSLARLWPQRKPTPSRNDASAISRAAKGWRSLQTKSVLEKSTPAIVLRASMLPCRECPSQQSPTSCRKPFFDPRSKEQIERGRIFGLVSIEISVSVAD